jgi:signal transduction histidine kinase
VWDAERIAQLASNLISNAVRYGEAGHSIDVALEDGPGDALEIRVHNDGLPIPREAIPALFEPFKRGERAEHAARQGLGLGLYIVREIVRAHGGEIEVRSKAGDGTTFIVRLPRQPPAAAAQAAPSVKPAAAAADSSGVIVRFAAA